MRRLTKRISPGRRCKMTWLRSPTCISSLSWPFLFELAGHRSTATLVHLAVRHLDLQAPRLHRAAADSAGLAFGLHGWEKLTPNRADPREWSWRTTFPFTWNLVVSNPLSVNSEISVSKVVVIGWNTNRRGCSSPALQILILWILSIGIG